MERVSSKRNINPIGLFSIKEKYEHVAIVPFARNFEKEPKCSHHSLNWLFEHSKCRIDVDVQMT